MKKLILLLPHFSLMLLFVSAAYAQNTSLHKKAGNLWGWLMVNFPGK